MYLSLFQYLQVHLIQSVLVLVSQPVLLSQFLPVRPLHRLHQKPATLQATSSLQNPLVRLGVEERVVM
ncbi:hypothetical protein [Streptococcus sanguinis]|uniref:hypothetical protein n=1 Tax=Streptococcus sanguinis TaxID=1305 RepID=UPI000A8C93E7|nr:hypothetical protein [Streptococcus sanguinis]